MSTEIYSCNGTPETVPPHGTGLVTAVSLLQAYGSSEPQRVHSTRRNQAFLQMLGLAIAQGVPDTFKICAQPESYTLKLNSCSQEPPEAGTCPPHSLGDRRKCMGAGTSSTTWHGEGKRGPGEQGLALAQILDNGQAPGGEDKAERASLGE